MITRGVQISEHPSFTGAKACGHQFAESSSAARDCPGYRQFSEEVAASLCAAGAASPELLRTELFEEKAH